MFNVFVLDHQYGNRQYSEMTLCGRDILHYCHLHDLNMENVDVELKSSMLKPSSHPGSGQIQTPRIGGVDREQMRAFHGKDMQEESDQTVWLNQDTFLVMGHEFGQYQYYTGNVGFATDMQ